MPEQQQTGIAIEGLATFRKALKSVGAELPKMLQKELKAAGEHAEFQAVRSYRGKYQSRRGKTINSIKLRATPTSLALAFGGTAFPYAKGQEFGSAKTKQFRPFTGRLPGERGSAGRFIYPAVRGEGPELLSELERVMAKLAKRAYPDKP